MSESGDRREARSDGDRRRDGSDALTYRIGADRTPSEAVVAAVAAWRFGERDRDAPLESAPALEPLYRTVDPDALDDLFRPAEGGAGRRRGRIEFEYEGYEVAVVDGSWIEGRSLGSE